MVHLLPQLMPAAMARTVAVGYERFDFLAL